MIPGTVVDTLIYYDQPLEIEIRGSKGQTYLALAVSIEGMEWTVWMIAEVERETYEDYLRNQIEVRDMFTTRAISRLWGDFWGCEKEEVVMVPIGQFPEDWLPKAGIFCHPEKPQ